MLDESPVSAASILNAASPNEVVFGGSATMNVENLARSLENDIQPGDEFIITGEHEGAYFSLVISTSYVFPLDALE